MNTRILYKIASQVRFREIDTDGKPEYIIERYSVKEKQWNIIARSFRIERALVKKHNAWYVELYKLNLSSKLLGRKKKRNQHHN